MIASKVSLNSVGNTLSVASVLSSRRFEITEVVCV